MNKYWKEKRFGDYVFYCGMFTKGDMRLGITLGNKESSVDILFFTVGFQKSFNIIEFLSRRD